MKKYLRLHILWICCVPMLMGSHSHPVREGGFQTSLENHLALFSSDPLLASAHYAICVLDVESGQMMAGRNMDQLLTPASVQKLVTTATALMVLGPCHRFVTTLEFSGEISANGRLDGDLYVRGGGDPSLGSLRMHDSLSLHHVFGHFLHLLHSQGIKEIAGHIYADPGLFDAELASPKWLWEDLGNYFGAGASGLSANENEYTVFFRAGSTEGDAATVVDVEPRVPGMLLLNQVTTGPIGSGDQVYIYGVPRQAERKLTGTVPLGSERFGVRGSIPDPPMFFVQSFHDFLTEEGIALHGQARLWEEPPVREHSGHKERMILGQWQSPPLHQLVHRTNISSVNLYAEHLLKAIGLELQGEGATRAGLEALVGFWGEAGVDLSVARLVDGSGLSPLNRITARQLADIMLVVSRHHIFPYLLESLPLAGHSGSLQRHFGGQAAEGRLRAKSGFLGHVRAFAGYTPAGNEQMALFVIMVNDYPGSSANLQRGILRLMNGIAEPPRHPQTR